MHDGMAAARLRLVRILPVLCFALTIGLALGGCGRGRSERADPVRITALPTEGAALLYIADQEGFFRRNDIVVAVADVATPGAGLEAMMQGEADLALIGQSLVVDRALRGEEIKVIASTSIIFTWRLVGPRSGIDEPVDLTGKRIGLSLGTGAEYYLSRFLELRGLDVRKLILVDLAPSEWVNAVAEGRVDAVMVRGADVVAIRERIGDEVFVWKVQENQPVFEVLAGRADWVAENPERVRQVLRALLEAEDFAVRKPEAAKRIVQNATGMEAAAVDASWPENHHRLSLTLALLMAMTGEARWMIANRRTGAVSVPDFLDHIYLDGLREVRPRAVNLNPRE